MGSATVDRSRIAERVSSVYQARVFGETPNTATETVAVPKELLSSGLACHHSAFCGQLFNSLLCVWRLIRAIFKLLKALLLLESDIRTRCALALCAGLLLAASLPKLQLSGF